MAALTAAAIGLAGLGVISALRQKTPKAPPLPAIEPPPQMQRLDSFDSTVRRKRAKAQITGASGRKSTLLTGPSGLTNLAPTERKTLLGS